MMQLIEVVLGYRGSHGTMRDAFLRARRDGALVDIPGLVYRRDEDVDAPLVTTGIQRLVQDLDEMPYPEIGYRLLERPHRGRELKAQPLAVSSIRRRSPIGSLSISHGCKFNCDYCPIPAYNQRTFRHKSGERVVEEMRQLREQLGIQYFFGTDDNFFNSRPAVEQMLETMSRATIAGRPLRKAIRWGTEATEFDTWKNRDLLRTARNAGLRALWLGIEDMTATLIKKGQSVSKTAELFALLNKTGITPMPMLMHHDGQPLYTRKGMYGLLNQVWFLRKAGAQSMQVSVLTPAVGTRAYDPSFENGLVFDTVGGKPLLQHQFDGNHVVASDSSKPWRVQLNVLVAYASYYNPVNFVRAFIRPANKLFMVGVNHQVLGMVGLMFNTFDSLRWAYRLRRGPVTRRSRPPAPKAPLIDVSGSCEQRDDSTSPRGNRRIRVTQPAVVSIKD
ncbi:MAG: radical SAM protein [Planctomycetes bacterium]|nr:radical SAM protein [Planctomycetota bacterium]